METQKLFIVLKDLFAVLRPHCTSRRRECREDCVERRQHFESWLKELCEPLSEKGSPWREIPNDCLTYPVANLVHQLRQCLVTHSWRKVLHSLDCLAHVPSKVDWIFWKATLAALYAEPENNLELIEQFFKQLYLLTEVNVLDGVLEHVMFLLTQGLTTEARYVINKKGTKPSGQKEFSKHVHDLLTAYQGLTYYADWRIQVSKAQQADSFQQSQSCYDMMQSQEDPTDGTIQLARNQALVIFQEISKKTGVWDIFLSKAIEIYEYYEDFEGGKSLLESYRQGNPDNPNAHRFLYEFLERNAAKFESDLKKEEIMCLESIARQDPANPLVLKLCGDLQESGDVRVIDYLFDLLDYDIWREKTDGWQFLAWCLYSVFSSGDLKKAREAEIHLAICWSTRKDWWPSYHFSTAALPKSAFQSDLLAAKIIISSVLLGKESDFCELAREYLDKATLFDVDLKVLQMIHFLLKKERQSPDRETEGIKRDPDEDSWSPEREFHSLKGLQWSPKKEPETPELWSPEREIFGPDTAPDSPVWAQQPKRQRLSSMHSSFISDYSI